MSNNNRNITYLDGIGLHRALVSGIQNVISRQDYLNKINVFPVPDSDTGTNMAFTLSAVIDGTSSNIHSSVGDMLEVVADSALDGARGNSGAILAQFFQGMSDGSEGVKKMTTKEFSTAIQFGAKYAHEALADPKEGTILTVLSDFSHHLVDKINEGVSDFINLFESGMKIAKESLDNTPNQLSVLKKAGVVDAGAQGFVDMLQGIHRFIKDGNIKEPLQSKPSTDNIINVDTKDDVTKMTYRYCTECMVKGDNIDRNHLREDLMDFGDSLVIAGTKKKAKIHIHVNEPAKVFKVCESYGDISGQKADDMFHQHDTAYSEHSEIAIVTDSGSDIPDELMDELDIHIVPVRYNFGNKGFVDKVSMTPDEFYQEIQTNPNHPQTSQPTPGDFRRQYQFLSSHYQSIISIHIPRILSGTLQSAETAFKRIQHASVSTIDSLSMSGGQGLIVAYAAEAAKKNYTHDEIVDLTQSIIPKTKIFAGVYDLSYAVRGGRIPKYVKLISDIFKITPILSTAGDGKIKLEGAFWGKSKFALRMANAIIKRLDFEKKYRVVVTHCNCKERGQSLLNILNEKLSNIHTSYLLDCGTALGVHAGPGSLVVGVQEYESIKPKTLGGNN